MSTAYTVDATIARVPARRAPWSLERGIAERWQRIKTLAKIAVLGTAALVVVAALLSIHIDNPPTIDRGCILTVNSHNSHVRPSLAVERDWHNGGLPILREPTGGACTAGK